MVLKSVCLNITPSLTQCFLWLGGEAQVPLIILVQGLTAGNVTLFNALVEHMLHDKLTL